MPRARRRKKKTVSTSPVKAVFLYGNPNKGKLQSLLDIQAEYTKLCNQYIQTLKDRTDLMVPIIKNDRKDSGLRALEKNLRPEEANSAFSQNAFDCAVSKLSNRLDSIRREMYLDDRNAKEEPLYTQSKVLFAMCVSGAGKDRMEEEFRIIAASTKKDNKFYTGIADALRDKSEERFQRDMQCFRDQYEMYSLLYGIPVLTHEQVMLDSRLMHIEPSRLPASDYVLSVTDPLNKRARIEVPIKTSGKGLSRLNKYKAAGSVSYMITKSGKLRVQWAVTRINEIPEPDRMEGVDTGITDCFYTSSGKAFGTMKEVIEFYKGTVEPSFEGLSDLRNKKKAIKHYLHSSKNLSEDVRRSLIAKMDKLEGQIRTTNTPYRKKRHYYQLLEQEIKRSVSAYVNSISPDTTTVIEKLDIKEFNKSKKVNGELSVFARGKLQQKLMAALEWEGYQFTEVAPEYTSQVCPVCSNLDKNNRNGKEFKCTVCGYKDDADHVGSINIRERAADQELVELCSKNEGQHKNLTKDLISYYLKKHTKWAQAHKAKAQKTA